MLEKNRGSLFGALVGDSYGLPFEQEAILDAGTRLVLRQYFDKLEGPFFQGMVRKCSTSWLKKNNV